MAIDSVSYVHYIGVTTHLIGDIDIFEPRATLAAGRFDPRHVMTPSSPALKRIRFEIFEADLRTEELSKSGRKVRLPNQSFCVLAMLLDKAGQLVTREELRVRLWPAGTFVEYDQGLNAAVNRLREALGDSAEEPRFIETLPKRGYRFIAAIQREDVPPAAPDLASRVRGVETVIASEPERPGASVFGPTGAPGPACASCQPTAAPVLVAGRSTTRARRIALSVAAGCLCAVLLIVGGISIVGHHSAADRPAGREVVPFTSLPGQEVAPTFSPDGSQIAFAWNGETGDEQQFDLYVKSIGSERMLRLTNHPSRSISPAWSPDGRSIAFARVADDGSGLFVIPALGGSERRIVSHGVALGHFIQIGWSPDGKRLAYSGYGPSGAQQIYLASLDTSNTDPVSPAPTCLDAAEPAFSPDGTQLAFICTSSSAVYSIYLATLPDAHLRLLASMMGDAQGLAWSADGSRLIFANDSGDGGQLWLLTLDGRLAQLAFGEDGSAPAVAARGARIAYVRGRNTTDIWRLDLTAMNPEESAVKLIYSTRTQMVPRYSHDGRYIAFQSNRSGSTEIWVTDAQGADPVRLTSFNGPSTSTPSWCSDGHRIAFDSRASGVSSIFIEDVNERVPRKVETSRTNLSFPVWSQDCRWLFASDAKNTLYRFPAAGGPEERFTERLSYYAAVVGDRVIFNVTEPNGVVLWAKSVGGGPEGPLEKMPKLSYTDAWAASPTGVYYTDTSTREPSVNFYEFASRTTRRITTLKKIPTPGGGFGITVSPDGRWLLYGEIDDAQSDIMLGASP